MIGVDAKLPYLLKSLLAAVLLLVLAYTGWKLWHGVAGGSVVNSYRDCVVAGNPVQTSYPSVCVTKDGKRFTSPANNVYQPPAESTAPGGR